MVSNSNASAREMAFPGFYFVRYDVLAAQSRAAGDQCGCTLNGAIQFISTKNKAITGVSSSRKGKRQKEKPNSIVLTKSKV